MDKSFRLIEFNVYDDENKRNISSNSENGDKKEFLVQVFGVNERGETCSILVEGFKPFFYVSVEDSWTTSTKQDFLSELRERMGEYYENSILSASLVKRKKLYGFDAGKLHKFLVIKFKNEMAMKRAIKFWYIEKTGAGGSYSKTLNPQGYVFNNQSLHIYESNIPPLLRLFHIKEISPSGWIAIPLSKAILHKTKTTSCHYEFTMNYKDIIPLPNKETIVPYKIASFDIEASSSHGDFPLPIKNYKKLATNIIDILNKIENWDIELLKNIILTAFGYGEVDDVERVYPKHQPSMDNVKQIFNVWIGSCPGKEKEG